MKVHYINKKGIEKVYNYNYKAKDNDDSLHYNNYKVTTKAGKLSKMAEKYDLVKRLYREYGIEYKNGIDDVITHAMEHKKSLTYQHIKAIFEENKLYTYILNMGLTPEEIIEQLKEEGEDVTRDMLLNQSNWVFTGNVGVFSINGHQYTIIFNYYEHTCQIERLNKSDN